MDNSILESASLTKQRPAFLRALGKDDPPRSVQIDQKNYDLVEVLKHDSWAATAIYQGPEGKAICKFNRQAPVFSIPMTWLGDLLAFRERTMLEALDDLPNVPRWLGHVSQGGCRLLHVVAREYIEGHPLGANEFVGDSFFSELRALLAEMHRRNKAYVDLHKRENVLVGDDGRPYLIDFQISLSLADWPLINNTLTRSLLRLFQAADLYHFEKLFVRSRPDLAPRSKAEAKANRPWWIRAHRLVSEPLRTLRRNLLVWLRVRSGRGRVSSEVFCEKAHREEVQRDAPSRKAA